MLNYIVNKIEDLIIDLRDNKELYIFGAVVVVVLGIIIGIPVGLYIG
jgi:hypothetical protein